MQTESYTYGTGKPQNFIPNLKHMMMFVLEFSGIHTRRQRWQRVAGMEWLNTGTET